MPSATTPPTSTAPRAPSSTRRCGSGSDDNLTVQIVRIDQLPDGDAGEIVRPGVRPAAAAAAGAADAVRRLPHRPANCMPAAAATSISRSTATTTPWSRVKMPSIDLRGDPAYLKRFMMEEWVARRIDSAACAEAAPARRDGAIFSIVVTEFVDGQTLTQWMIDNPQPDLETVRGIVEQIAQGAAGVPPQGNAASGPAARQHHDRQDRAR